MQALASERCKPQRAKPGMLPTQPSSRSQLPKPARSLLPRLRPMPRLWQAIVGTPNPNLVAFSKSTPQALASLLIRRNHLIWWNLASYLASLASLALIFFQVGAPSHLVEPLESGQVMASDRAHAVAALKPLLNCSSTTWVRPQ